ncbi:hypothetical protein KC335_g65 [Hortaea werneckii]|nr:hypothetical protein KC335_g65 [Hortaea werneckii]
MFTVFARACVHPCFGLTALAASTAVFSKWHEGNKRLRAFMSSLRLDGFGLGLQRHRLCRKLLLRLGAPFLAPTTMLLSRRFNVLLAPVLESHSGANTMAALKKLASTLRLGNTRPTNPNAGSTGNEESLIKPKKLAKFHKGALNLQQHEGNSKGSSVAQLSSTQAQVSTQDNGDQVSIRTVSSYSIDEEIRDLAALSRRYESTHTHLEASSRNIEDQAPIYSCLWNSSYVRLKDLPASVDRYEAFQSKSRLFHPGSNNQFFFSSTQTALSLIFICASTTYRWEKSRAKV